MPSPKVSVIVPTYNRLHTLPRAVGSVLAQTERDFELIVVDDASTDGTADYLSGLRDPRVRAIEQRGQPARPLGVSGARNLGLEAARADIVAFLDSDDAFLPNRLEVTLAAFAREPDVVCAVASSRRWQRRGTRASTLPDIKLAPTVAEWACFAELFPTETSGLTVRRAAARQIGGFARALSLSEDREFMVRLAPHGAVRLIPEILWEKYQSGDGLSEDKARAGQGLLAYLRQCPAYRERYPKIVSYLITRILVSDLRYGLWRALARDLREFRAAGLLSGGPARLWRDHREVRSYRRWTSNANALASIADPPQTWV